MKYSKLKPLALVIIFLISVSIGVFGLNAKLVSAADISKQQQVDCYKKYNGHGVGPKTDDKFRNNLKKDYEKSKCDTSKGGNCEIVEREKGTEAIVVRCSNPNATSTTSPDEDCSDCSTSDYDKNDCASGSFDQLDGSNCGILKYILLITNVLSGIAGTVIVAMIIAGGIQYATAGPDPSKIQAAKQKITNALLALLLFIFGFAILQYLVPGGIL